MKAVFASFLLASLCAASSHSQELRKLITLPTPSAVSSVAVCGQSGLVAALGRDGSITVFRLASAEEVTKRRAEAGLGILPCSPDGKLLATSKGDETVMIADVSGTALRKSAITGQRVERLIFSPDSSMLAVQLYESPTQLWDVAHGILIAALQTNFSGSGGVGFSPDSSQFATADLDNVVRIYDRSGNLKAKYAGLLLEPFALSFLPDGKQLALGRADSKLSFLDACDGHLLRTLSTGSDPVFVAWAPAGRKLAREHASRRKLVETLHFSCLEPRHREIQRNAGRCQQGSRHGSAAEGPGGNLSPRDSNGSVTEGRLPN